MNQKFPARLAAGIITLSLAACSHYATISERQPLFRSGKPPDTSDVSVDRKIESAMRNERREPLSAIAGYLAIAEESSRKMARNPADTDARDAYNFALARIFGTIRKSKLDPWTQPLRIPSEGGDYLLTRKPDKRESWNPTLYDFTPADQFDIHGTYMTERPIREGIGAPLVAVGKEMNKNAEKDFSIPRVYYGVTAVVRFEGRRAVISLEDPLATEEVSLGGHHYSLAADFSVPIAVMLASNDPKKLEIARLLHPEKYAETARIARLQPYDPNKTVILIIHGLADSPATWAPMINNLRSDKEIRQNYQFWFYSYPSGYPYPHSAAILRRELDAIQQRFPLRKEMVVVGHSMGGCISRLLITDTTDEKLWLSLVKKPPGQVQLSADSRRLFTEALIFKNRPEIGRVVFIAAPLRGSDLASRWMGRLGSMLVKSPARLLKAGNDAMKIASFQGDDLRLNRIPNSVDTLAPNNRFVRAIQTMPIVPGVPYHVISGDRGKGGHPDKTPPVKSDGVVPYWSSHMDGAQSELVVPSAHSAHQNPQAIAEVKRILKLNERITP